MKKIISSILIVIMILSAYSIMASADETTAPNFDELTNDQLIFSLMNCLNSLYERKLITGDEQTIIYASLDPDRMHNEDRIQEFTWKALSLLTNGYKTILANKSDENLPEEYSFGQGTFVVGADLKAGTYDITCKSTSDDDFDDSMSGFSDFYAGQGMDDYADMFSSIGGMYDSIAGMTVETIDKDGLMDKYLTLKSGETARIILEDGMKLELSGGSADLVFVR